MNKKQFRIGVVMQAGAAHQQIVAEVEEAGMTAPTRADIVAKEKITEPTALYTEWQDFIVGTEFSGIIALLLALQIKYGVRCVMEYRPAP